MPCCVTRCSAVLFVSLLAVSVGAVPHLAILFVLSCPVLCSCVPWCFLGQCVVALCAVLVDVAPCLGALRCLRHPVCYAASQSAVLRCALRWRLALPFFLLVLSCVVMRCAAYWAAVDGTQGVVCQIGVHSRCNDERPWAKTKYSHPASPKWYNQVVISIFAVIKVQCGCSRYLTLSCFIFYDWHSSQTNI